MWTFEKIARALDMNWREPQAFSPSDVAIHYRRVDDWGRRRVCLAAGLGERAGDLFDHELAADHDLALKVGEAFVASLQEYVDLRDAKNLAKTLE